MLIKAADDQSELLRALEHEMNTAQGAQARKARDEFYIRSAGIKGEKESAYLIDFDYGKSPNWAVIHDLRLEHGGRTAQIDHVLINRWMDVYVLEIKHFSSGMKITETGEFLRYNSYKRTYEGMASPLEQNERHMQVLRDVLDTIELPTRLGLRIPPNLQSFVLVAPTARVDRPKRFDTSRIVKADQLKNAIWRDYDAENPLFGMLRTAAKIVSGETVEFVARQLAARHAPLMRAGNRVAEPAPVAVTDPARPATQRCTSARIEPSFGKPPAPTPSPQAPNHAPVAPAREAPTCKSCGGRAGSVLYGKYGYYFKCAGCATNTAIRFQCQPGHSPRLRKDGLRFFRECADCNDSALFHTNTAGT
jgi:hypothetical protein